jgi:hypothetical protein
VHAGRLRRTADSRGRGCVEAEQRGESLTRALGCRDGLAVEGRLLDLSRHRLDHRIPDPSLALGVELGGLEPIEQLAEEIRVILKP